MIELFDKYEKYLEDYKLNYDNYKFYFVTTLYRGAFGPQQDCDKGNLPLKDKMFCHQFTICPGLIYNICRDYAYVIEMNSIMFYFISLK